jgi:hypothetical protein
MDTAPSDARELSVASSWGDDSSPHELAEALLLLLPLLPLDCRARAACVCRAWRAAAAHPGLWKELSFEGCKARVDNATLTLLCARAGAALRTLCLDAGACKRVTFVGTVTALRGGGCAGLRRLDMPNNVCQWEKCFPLLSAETAQQLAAACPML